MTVANLISSDEVTLPLVPPSFDASKIDPTSIGEQWLTKLNDTLHTGKEGAIKVDGDALPSLLTAQPSPWWKDHLALTWSLRTLHTTRHILDLLQVNLPVRKLTPFKFVSAALIPMMPGLSFVQVQFTFENDVAVCSGLADLVPDEEGTWRAWIIFTDMQHLKGHEPDISRLDVPDKEDVKEAKEVEVLIVGAGQAGLQLSAVLRTIGVPNLVVERGARVGDHWRRHYDCFKLHLTKWYCQFLYRPWPANTPIFPTLLDIVSAINSYADTTHLNVLTSTQVEHAKYSETVQKWEVQLANGEGKKWTVMVGQMVLACGTTGWTPAVPSIPGKEEYQGTAMHSMTFKSAQQWSGKKAIVVGVGCSGHDIAQDLYRHGAQATLIQRNPTMVFQEEVIRHGYSSFYNENGPPLEVADRIQEAMPTDVVRLLMAAAPPNDTVKAREAGLIKAGFRLKEHDLMHIIKERGGGHYLDIGCSDLIVEKKIGIKSGVPITSFTKTGVAFADGTEMDADLVVFATGFTVRSMQDAARAILGEEGTKGLKEVWGMDSEKELNGVYRSSGHPRLWYCGGTFPMARYYAKMLALQIQATQLGLLHDRCDL